MSLRTDFTDSTWWLVLTWMIWIIPCGNQTCLHTCRRYTTWHDTLETKWPAKLNLNQTMKNAFKSSRRNARTSLLSLNKIHQHWISNNWWKSIFQDHLGLWMRTYHTWIGWKPWLGTCLLQNRCGGRYTNNRLQARSLPQHTRVQHWHRQMRRSITS